MSESTIIMTKSANKLDPTLKKKAFAFLQKLTEDDAAPGLHIEPIVNSIDKKVRTGRVDQGFRAVLFKLTEGGTNTYVFHGIWPHDDAITVAMKTTLTLNPINGVTEIRTADTPAPPTPTDTTPAPGFAPPEPEQSTAMDDRAAFAWAFPHSGEALVGELGLSTEVAVRAVACRDEDELLDFAAGLGDWQGDVLLDLAVGTSLAEAKDHLELTTRDEPFVETDEAILSGMRHPAARMWFAEIEGSEELRQVIEAGDFGAWRVFLHPQQAAFATKSFNGPARITGGAGTGKTVVLLHRARHLATEQPASRIVLTTFTTNLADAIRSDLDRLDPSLPRAGGLGGSGVHVAGVDALAAAVIRAAGPTVSDAVEAVLGQGHTDVARRTNADQAWKAAIAAAGADLPEHLRSASFLAAEYGLVILPGRFTDRDGYLLARRPGRGVRLSRPQRAAVWAVVEAYRLSSRIAGSIDYPEAAAIAAAHLDLAAERGVPRPVDHVLVDEGQDLSPTQWQLLRALVTDGHDDLFIAEDGHQRIYGHRVVLSHFGIRTVGRSRRLTLNYRTTEETLAYAVSLLEGSAYLDLEDELDTTTGYRSARRGPRPVVRGFDTPHEEFTFAGETIQGWLDDDEPVAPETIAILVRDRYQRDKVVTALGDMGVDVRGVDGEAIKPGRPVVMTMHRAKGTEFSRIILFGLGAKSTPPNLQSYRSSDADLSDAYARERSLLYVAASRARDELVATWNGDVSPLLKGAK